MCLLLFIFTDPLWHTRFYAHFTDEQTKAQRSLARAQGHTAGKSGPSGVPTVSQQAWAQGRLTSLGPSWAVLL